MVLGLLTFTRIYLLLSYQTQSCQGDVFIYLLFLFLVSRSSISGTNNSFNDIVILVVGIMTPARGRKRKRVSVDSGGGN